MMLRRGLGLGALALLAGCGRIGPVRPPGPADRITYPRGYPYQAPRRAAAPPPDEDTDQSETTVPPAAPTAAGRL